MERTPISVKAAVQTVIDHCSRKMELETISLQTAYGRILGEPIIAKHDVPPFNRSAYDGYAVRAEDTIDATSETAINFRVIGEIGAGHVGDKALGEKEAYRIMTGAILPPKADAIVMLEDTTETSDGFSLTKTFQSDDNISFQGEDAQKGEELLPVGSVIHPGTIAILATFGYAHVKVARLPKVSLVSTGTELLEVDEPLVPGKIRNSNGPMLQGQLARMGIPFESLGTMEDDLDACTDLITRALKKSDIVITTGGVSVGDYDYLPEIYQRLGATVLFDKVMMRPGSVTTVAELNGKLLFGLSGNPSACFTGFELFVRPALLSMMNCGTPYMPRMKAVLGEDFPKNNPFTRFVRAIWYLEDDIVKAVPAGFNKSNAVSSIARGNGIIVLPSGSSGFMTGMEVDVLLLGQEIGASKWDI